jgi:hypothetical protein
VESIHNLPRAFSGLSQNPESTELRTFQRKAQVGSGKPFSKVIRWTAKALGVQRCMLGKMLSVHSCSASVGPMTLHIGTSEGTCQTPARGPPSRQVNQELWAWCLHISIFLNSDSNMKPKLRTSAFRKYTL